jgi:hypothetical protein
MMTIAFSGWKGRGRVALIDDEDLPLVAPHLWWIDESKRKSGSLRGPYARTEFRRDDGRLVKPYMHSLITGWPMTDHVNHNGLDNRRSNLRPATHAQNLHNQRLRDGGSSRYKGVCWHKRLGKWQAGLTIDSRYVYLGLYVREEEAALAYNTAALEAFGAYAYFNPVEPEPKALAS